MMVVVPRGPHQDPIETTKIYLGIIPRCDQDFRARFPQGGMEGEIIDLRAGEIATRCEKNTRCGHQQLQMPPSIDVFENFE
jgi:hypothetical protein